MRSGAATVETYLAELPPEKRDLVAALRALVLETLPEGYVETMNWGMICYEVPLERSGRTYNGRPLMYVAIGAQKRHVGLYLCGLYCRAPLKARFEAAYAAAGRRLDMGKSCVRIRNETEIDREAIAEAVAAMTVEDYIEASRR